MSIVSHDWVWIGINALSAPFAFQDPLVVRLEVDAATYSAAELDQVLAVMALTQQHTYHIWTKNPEYLLRYILSKEFDAASHLSERGCWASKMANVLCGQGICPYEETQDEELKGHDGYNEDGLSTDHIYEALMQATSQGFIANVWLVLPDYLRVIKWPQMLMDKADYTQGL